MKNLIGSLFALLLLAGTSCQESVDIEAEKQLIKDMVTAAFEAEQQKDLDAILSYFAEDVIGQLPNMPQVQGLEAMRDFYTEYFKILVSIEGWSTEITVSKSGDMAWDYGGSRSVINGPDGPIEDETKYLEVWKKIDGEWKVVAISASSDKPAM